MCEERERQMRGTSGGVKSFNPAHTSAKCAKLFLRQQHILHIKRPSWQATGIIDGSGRIKG